MNLETIFLEKERIKSEESSSVKSSLSWLRNNGYHHYIDSYTEKKTPINLVEVLKINNVLNGNELLTLFQHVENLNKNLAKNELAKSTSSRPQSLMLPIDTALQNKLSNKNRWSCRMNSPDPSDRSKVNKEVRMNPFAIERSHVVTLPSPFVDIDVKSTDKFITQHKNLFGTFNTQKSKIYLKSPKNVLQKKSKFIGGSKHNSLTTVLEQHANDEFDEITNESLNENKYFFQLNTSDSENSSLFSILSEPSKTVGLNSPIPNNKNHSKTKKVMTSNPLSNTVPEISLEQSALESPNWTTEKQISESDSDLLQPVIKGDRLSIKDASLSSESNRQSFSSWGYEFELGNGSQELSNDSIDMGESGRINFRTGSFMTRFRHNSKITTHPISPRSSVGTPTQQCMNWALCKEESCHSGVDNVEDELNPVLNNLLSDMDSLDSFRHMMYSRKSLNSCDDFYRKKVSSLKQDAKHLHLTPDSSFSLNNKIEDLIKSEKNEREDNKMIEIKDVHVSNENKNKKDSFKKALSTRKRNHPFRWSSLARSNQPEEFSHDLELSYFSLNQFQALKKLAMLKLTSILDKNIPSQRSQFNWKFPKLLSTKTKPTDFPTEVFGVPLSHWQSKIGQPLPPVIYHALKYIRLIGPDADGIFRRAGGKARINELKKEIESNPDLMDFSNWQPYDVADMIKSFFRSLPECLMTNKFSTTLISIITYVPELQWLETIQWGIINLPDENRLVLQSLLYFLGDLAKHSEKTKMTSINLAVCLSPSLFHSPHSMGSSAVSPMRMRKNNQGPDPRDLASQKSTHICLKFMIDHASYLFRISEETISKAHIQLHFEKPVMLNKLLRGSNDWIYWIKVKVDDVMSEYNHKFKNWTSIRKDIFKNHQDKDHICQGLEVFYKKNLSNSDKNNDSESIIGTWRITAEVDSTATIIADKILYKRHEWDPEIACFQIKKEISNSVDICYMEAVSNPPQLNREMTLIRGCERNIQGHIIVLVTQSIDDQLPYLDKRYPLTQKSMNTQQNQPSKITANVFREDVIIESFQSSQRSRINWISKVDLRGMSSDWYFRQWSHVLIRRMVNLKTHISRNEDRE